MLPLVSVFFLLSTGAVNSTSSRSRACTTNSCGLQPALASFRIRYPGWQGKIVPLVMKRSRSREHHSLLHGLSPANCNRAWESMEGSDSVRACPICQARIFRADGLDETQLLELVAATEPIADPSRLKLYRRPDGTLMLEPGSCRLRARLAVTAIVLLVTLFAAIGASISIGPIIHNWETIKQIILMLLMAAGFLLALVIIMALPNVIAQWRGASASFKAMDVESAGSFIDDTGIGILVLVLLFPFRMARALCAKPSDALCDHKTMPDTCQSKDGATGKNSDLS
jgi:hypothetical protein